MNSVSVASGGSDSSGSVVSANSLFDLIVKTALMIENAPIDIPESSMPSVKPYSNCRTAMKVNSAEASMRIVPATEILKRFFVSVSIAPAKPNAEAMYANAAKSMNPMEPDVS